MRYERRAAATRDKALKELLSVMRQLNNNGSTAHLEC
jgi:hypothetical protein